MKFRLILSLLATSAVVYTANAQSSDDDDEYFTDLGYYANAKNKLNFGFRMAKGAKVNFGNLGTIPSIRSIAALSEGSTTRAYDNGAVVQDALRTGEFDLDADGNPVKDANGKIIQTSTPGGRYQTRAAVLDSDGKQVVDENGDPVYTQTGDYLSYTAGRTRSWNYLSGDQVTADGSGIRMSAYSTTSEGAVASSDRPISNGFELEASREIFKLGDRFRLNLIGGIGLSSINNKSSGNIRATLHILTDTFSLLGNPAPSVGTDGSGYTGPTYTDLVVGDNTITNGKETTTPIADTPSSREQTTVAAGANVSGVWQIRGAYFVMKVGPQVQALLTKNIGLQAAAGFSGAYVGTTYKAVEKLNIDNVSAEISTTESADYSKFLPGYFANVDATWAVNDRTGFFAGASYEAFSDYSQTVGGRTAVIDLGGQAGLRGGMSIKF